jgi:uncharacterized membrane protein YfcA
VTLLLLSCAIFASAAFAQNVTGFGFALIAVPLLAMTTDPRSAVIAATAVSLVQSGYSTWTQRHEVLWRPARRLLTTSASGMPFGLLVLHFTPPPLLTALIAALTLVCTLLVATRLHLRPAPFTITLAGILCGIFSTSTGTTGPPLVAALQAMDFDPRAFRATLAAVFTGTAAGALAAITITGTLTRSPLLTALYGIPAALLGSRAGTLLAERLSPALFRHLILAALTAGSCAALLNVFA